jgi:hypothetical protein
MRCGEPFNMAPVCCCCRQSGRCQSTSPRTRFPRLGCWWRKKEKRAACIMSFSRSARMRRSSEVDREQLSKSTIAFALMPADLRPQGRTAFVLSEILASSPAVASCASCSSAPTLRHGLPRVGNHVSPTSGCRCTLPGVKKNARSKDRA